MQAVLIGSLGAFQDRRVVVTQACPMSHVTSRMPYIQHIAGWFEPSDE